MEPAAAADGNRLETRAGCEGDGCIAGSERLEAICGLPAAERPPLDAACRGVLAETALTGRQRYEWRLLLPLLHSLVDSVLADFTQQQDEEVGPPRPPPPGFDSPAALAARLHALLEGHEAAPFTLQRLCEVLLEPRKQYARLDKVVLAIEKLLMVTSTRRPDPAASLPPPPALGTLSGVNSNPPSPYLDGRPPQVLDQQQHAALLQQHAAALAAAQQQHGGPLDSLDDQMPPLEPVPEGEARESAAEAAAAADEAMQLDAPPRPISAAEAASAARFVESALADAGEGGAASGVGATPNGLLPTAAGGEPAAVPQQQEQQQHRPAGEGKPPNGAAMLAAAAATGDNAGADVAMSAVDGPAHGEQQQQGGPVPMDHASGAEGGGQGAAGGIARVIAQLQLHLPQAVQEVILPPLIKQQQQRQQGATPGAAPAGQQAPAGAAAGEGTALHQLVVSALTELPQDTAAVVLGQLQPLLPPQVLRQLQQQRA